MRALLSHSRQETWKYLTIAERDRFLKTAELAPREARRAEISSTPCLTIRRSSMPGVRSAPA